MCVDGKIIGLCGEIGSFAKILISGGGGLIVSTVWTGFEIIAGSGLGKLIYWIVNSCFFGKATGEKINDELLSKEIKNMLSNAKKTDNVLKTSYQNLNQVLTRCTGISMILYGAFFFNFINYLDIPSDLEIGDQIELGLKITSLVIIALGLGITIRKTKKTNDITYDCDWISNY